MFACCYRIPVESIAPEPESLQVRLPTKVQSLIDDEPKDPEPHQSFVASNPKIEIKK
jgi:hypothetical protein